MENKQAPNNVLPFPSRKKDGEQPAQPAAPTPPKKKPSSKKNVSATVIAVILFTAAVNRYVFTSGVSSTDMASNAGSGRGLASVERANYQRDAQWEKELSESLASDKVRDVASMHVGRPATMEEKLRWGTLEEKYTVTFRPDVHEIQSISFQDPNGTPSYVLDRARFLDEYHELFNSSSAKLKSVEQTPDKTVESYTLYNKDHQPKGEARFELDRYMRLHSLKVEPTQI